MKILLGFKSRCRMCFSWISMNPRIIYANIRMHSVSPGFIFNIWLNSVPWLQHSITRYNTSLSSNASKRRTVFGFFKSRITFTSLFTYFCRFFFRIRALSIIFIANVRFERVALNTCPNEPFPRISCNTYPCTLVNDFFFSSSRTTLGRLLALVGGGLLLLFVALVSLIGVPTRCGEEPPGAGIYCCACNFMYCMFCCAGELGSCCYCCGYVSCLFDCGEEYPP